MTASATADLLRVTRAGVATITLNRPDALNAVSPAMSARLAALLRDSDSDPEVRAIVLTGAGRGFCAGADLAVLAGSLDDLAASIADPATFPTTAMEISTPVIAAVNGPAAGVGAVFALTADVRLAAASATFTFPFSRLGLTAEYATSWLLPRLVGDGAARDLLLSGRTIDATEALRIGLVSQIVADDDLPAHAAEYAGQLVRRCSPAAMKMIKAQLAADREGSFAQAFARSIPAMVTSIQEPDLTEAIAALNERRLPRFGRIDSVETS